MFLRSHYLQHRAVGALGRYCLLGQRGEQIFYRIFFWVARGELTQAPHVLVKPSLCSPKHSDGWTLKKLINTCHKNGFCFSKKSNLSKTAETPLQTSYSNSRTAGSLLCLHLSVRDRFQAYEVFLVFSALYLEHLASVVHWACENNVTSPITTSLGLTSTVLTASGQGSDKLTICFPCTSFDKNRSSQHPGLSSWYFHSSFNLQNQLKAKQINPRDHLPPALFLSASQAGEEIILHNITLKARTTDGCHSVIKCSFAIPPIALWTGMICAYSMHE